MANWWFKKSKCWGLAYRALGWETKHDAPKPNNSPTHRAMTGNNIPIVYPPDNLHALTQERVFFLSLPLNVESMEGTWIRAIAMEDQG